MVKKILLFVVVLPWLLWAFAPKKELYYLLEKRLADRGVVLAGEELRETPVGLTVSHAVLYVKGVQVAAIEKASVWSLLLYSRGAVTRITLDPSLKRMLPEAIQQVAVTHSVLHPSILYLHIDDPQMTASGTIDLRTRALRLSFAKAPASELLRRRLKKNGEGWVYEQRF